MFRNHILNQHMCLLKLFCLRLEQGNLKRSKNINYVNKDNIGQKQLELLFGHPLNHKMMRVLFILSAK